MRFDPNGSLGVGVFYLCRWHACLCLPVPTCACLCVARRQGRQAGHADRADRENRDVSIAIAIPLPVPLARQTGIAIAMNCGIEPVAGTWMDGMNADDAGRMRVRFWIDAQPEHPCEFSISVRCGVFGTVSNPHRSRIHPSRYRYRDRYRFVPSCLPILLNKAASVSHPGRHGGDSIRMVHFGFRD